MIVPTFAYVVPTLGFLLMILIFTLASSNIRVLGEASQWMGIFDSLTTYIGSPINFFLFLSSIMWIYSGYLSTQLYDICECAMSSSNINPNFTQDLKDQIDNVNKMSQVMKYGWFGLGILLTFYFMGVHTSYIAPTKLKLMLWALMLSCFTTFTAFYVSYLDKTCDKLDKKKLCKIPGVKSLKNTRKILSTKINTFLVFYSVLFLGFCVTIGLNMSLYLSKNLKTTYTGLQISECEQKLCSIGLSSEMAYQALSKPDCIPTDFNYKKGKKTRCPLNIASDSKYNAIKRISNKCRNVIRTGRQAASWKITDCASKSSLNDLNVKDFTRTIENNTKKELMKTKILAPQQEKSLVEQFNKLKEALQKNSVTKSGRTLDDNRKATQAIFTQKTLINLQIPQDDTCWLVIGGLTPSTGYVPESSKITIGEQNDFSKRLLNAFTMSEFKESEEGIATQLAIVQS